MMAVWKIAPALAAGSCVVLKPSDTTPVSSVLMAEIAAEFFPPDHGRTNLTMALTAKNMPCKQGFGPFAPEVYRVPRAYPYRWPTGPGNCADEAFAAFTELVHTQVGEANTAAVIIEPIQGEGWFIVPAPGFLARVAGWCREHRIVFVADEIQSGFCRTGDWFACEHEGVLPDLITTAKGIAGGLPLAAVTGGDRSDGCGARWRAGWNLRQQPGRVRGRAGREVRGRGAMLAVELVEPGATKQPNPALTAAVSAACHQQGLITLTCGTFGNVIQFLPPLVFGKDLLHEGLDILDAAFAQLPVNPAP